MLYKFKVFVMSIILAAYVLSVSGCAVGWFLAGAGTAATAAVVMNENEKAKAE